MSDSDTAPSSVVTTTTTTTVPVPVTATTTTTTKTATALDFDSVTMYTEIVGVFALIATGTYIYTLRGVLPGVAPFVVLVFAIAIFAIDVYQRQAWARALRKTDDPPAPRPRTLGAALVWILWLVYGIVFRDVAPLLPDSFAYAQSAIAVALVLATYVRRDLVERVAWSSGALLAAVLLLFIPHADTVTHDMGAVLLIGKTLAFYVLYVFTEVSQMLHEAEDRRRAVAPLTPVQRVRRSVANAQIKVLQSAWVLLATKYFVFGAIVQLLPLYVDISTMLNKRPAAADATDAAAAAVELSEIVVHDGSGRRLAPKQQQQQRSPRNDSARRSMRATAPSPASDRAFHMNTARASGIGDRVIRAPQRVARLPVSALAPSPARRTPPFRPVVTGLNKLSDDDVMRMIRNQ